MDLFFCFSYISGLSHPAQIAHARTLKNIYQKRNINEASKTPLWNWLVVESLYDHALVNKTIKAYATTKPAQNLYS